MPRLQVEMCEKCQQDLTDFANDFGEQAMKESALSLLANCPICSKKFPDELRHQIRSGQYAVNPSHKPMEKKGTIIF